MAKPFDFNNRKRAYMTVNLGETTLLVTTPTKSVMESLLALHERFGAGEVNENVVNDLYDICARILSQNKAGVQVDRETIEDTVDFEGLVQFIQAYTEFISEVTNSKN